jgi:hypothetical protein
MINVQLIKWETGYLLTDSGQRIRAPWDDSPEYPVAVEEAPPIVVTRITPSLVQLEWTAGLDGPPATADVWIDVTVDAAQPVDHYVIDWGDFSSDVKPGYGLKVFHFQAKKEHIFGEAGVFVSAYDANDILIESQIFTPTWHLLAVHRVSQYRIERFKGRFQYAEQGKRWLQDWSPIPTTYNGDLQIEATDRWNWGFRLWLREVDDQGRPGLIMVPSAWAATGTGEGSIPLPVLTGWGSEWGSMWGST